MKQNQGQIRQSPSSELGMIGVVAHEESDEESAEESSSASEISRPDSEDVEIRLFKLEVREKYQVTKGMLVCIKCFDRAQEVLDQPPKEQLRAISRFRSDQLFIQRR